jgi:hypothetical protein
MGGHHMQYCNVKEHHLDVVVALPYPFDDYKTKTFVSQSYKCDVEVNFPPFFSFFQIPKRLEEILFL